MSTSTEPGQPLDVGFLVPGDLPGPSGGTHYNHAVAAALTDAGHRVRVLRIPGRWPRPTASERAALRRAMAGHALVVVDGIMALAAPVEVEDAVRGGSRVHILVHSLLTADPGLDADEGASFAASECSAMRAATSVSVPSRWSARDVSSRCPAARPHVVWPGTMPAPVAGGSSPPRLLVLAALTPVKNQEFVLRALCPVRDLPWTAQFVGSRDVAPDHVRRLRETASREFAAGRVAFPGALTGRRLDDAWDATDLLLLTSTSETFGMVVTEAHARGIPAVVTAGTGAVEALLGGAAHDAAAPPGSGVPGAVVDARDPTHLADTLRSWLTDPVLRGRWRVAALARRTRLQGWERTAELLVRILQP